MAKNALDAKLAQIDAEIARLTDIKTFLLQDAPAEPSAEPKVRKPRKKKGLPAEPSL